MMQTITVLYCDAVYVGMPECENFYSVPRTSSEPIPTAYIVGHLARRTGGWKECGKRLSDLCPSCAAKYEELQKATTP